MFEYRHGEGPRQRAFLSQIASLASLPYLMMGFYDSKSGDLTVSWKVQSENCPADTCRYRMQDILTALAAYTSGSTAQNAEYVPTWREAGESRLGIGSPIGDVFPVMVFPASHWSQDSTVQAILRIGMVYVQQQLPEVVYSRSPWPDGLAEATLQVLSLRFLLVDGKAEIQHDGRLQDEDAEDAPAWIVANRRLTLHDEKERCQLHAAIRRATDGENATSIVPVTTIAGAVRLVVVAPVSRSDPPTAMVLFEQSGTDHAVLREHFFSAHGLTKSERRIAHVLLDGGTLHDAAEAASLSLETVRSYLKRIFVKTGIHRQSELIALYYRSILPVGNSIAQAGNPPT